MTHPMIPALLLALVAPVATAPAQDVRSLDGVEVAQVTIHERIVIRVPRMAAAPVPVRTPDRWKEKKGPKCLSTADMAGALVTAPDAVDLVMQGGTRMRAKLGRECSALAFYSGFYIKPGMDHLVCAKRDAIRSRSGGNCPIEAFRTLKPVR